MNFVLDNITPMMITYNEAPNIRRTLSKLLWARRILVIDSGSSDETLTVLRNYSQVEVLHHPFKDFASQCNFGITQISTPWVLSLDADYELSDALVKELQLLTPATETAGYQCQFIYRIYGRPLRGSLYPSRVVLYRKDRAIYRNEGHGHRVSINGNVLPLAGPIYHDDRKPLAHWLCSQLRYARQEADHLLSSDRTVLGRTDRVRLAAWPAPFAVVIYTLVVKGCLLDGWAGWFYALQRALSETLIALEIINKRLRTMDEGRAGSHLPKSH
jgi:glycosyltransferase involved in cell wall biosynthesis